MATFKLDATLTPLSALATILAQREEEQAGDSYSTLINDKNSSSYKELEWLRLGHNARIEHSLPTEFWLYQLLTGPEYDVTQLPFDDLGSIDFGVSVREFRENFSHTLDIYCGYCPRDRALARVGRVASQDQMNPLWITFQITGTRDSGKWQLGWADILECPDCMPWGESLTRRAGVDHTLSPVSLDHFWTQAILDSRIMGQSANRVKLRYLNAQYQKFSPRRVSLILNDGIFDTEL